MHYIWRKNKHVSRIPNSCGSCSNIHHWILEKNGSHKLSNWGWLKGSCGLGPNSKLLITQGMWNIMSPSGFASSIVLWWVRAWRHTLRFEKWVGGVDRIKFVYIFVLEEKYCWIKVFWASHSYLPPCLLQWCLLY